MKENKIDLFSCDIEKKEFVDGGMVNKSLEILDSVINEVLAPLTKNKSLIKILDKNETSLVNYKKVFDYIISETNKQRFKYNISYSVFEEEIKAIVKNEINLFFQNINDDNIITFGDIVNYLNNNKQKISIKDARKALGYLENAFGNSVLTEVNEAFSTLKCYLNKKK